MQLQVLAAASAALVPGVHAWWTGRSLIARTTDPAFAELLLARRMRGIQVLAAAIACLIVFASPHSIWTLPLLGVGVLVGGFSFRRALYGETWAMFDYVNYVTASIVGGAGFWLLLGFAPRLILALSAGWFPEQPMAGALVLGVLVGLALLAWERNYPRVWLAAHRATPLERRDLIERFEDIARLAGIAMPGVFRYGAAGSYAMNAVALPSVREPGVAFGDTLLEMLEPDEITAIFAHELAHLEYYDARMLRRARIATSALIAGAMTLPVIALQTIPSFAGIVSLVWPLLVLGILIQHLRRSQANESESDRRSSALVGDPEAMIRALTKLHHYSRIPRRWPHDFERSATHPSLARRIQALRGEGATSAPSMEAPVVLRTTAAGRWIALDATRIYWFDGVPADAPAAAPGSTEASAGAVREAPSIALLRERAASYRAVAYTELVELRVGIAGPGRALFGRDRAGKKWLSPLHISDVAAAQSALDALDGQLAPRSAKDRAGSMRLLFALVALGITSFVIGRAFATKDVRLAWTPGAMTDVASFDLPGAGFDLDLSPTGRRVAIRTADSTSEERYYDDEALVQWRYVIADSSGPLRSTTAYHLAFATDDRVLAIRAVATSRDSMAVSLESATGADSIVWRRTVPAFLNPTIHIDREHGVWTAFGQGGESGDIIVVSGSVAADSLVVRHESYIALGGLPLYAYPDGAVLVARLASPNQPMFLALMGMAIRWEIVRVADGDAEELGSVPGFPQCERATEGAALMCVVHARKRSLWRIDDDHNLTSLGTVPGAFDLWSVGEGTRMLASSRMGALAMVDPGAGLATRLELRADGLGTTSFVTGAASAPGTIAVMVVRGGRSEVRIYRLR